MIRQRQYESLGLNPYFVNDIPFDHMLFVLRRLRHALMEPNSTRKYLLYALGEILLVVIGIMIALQVNNWNENSRNIKEGQRLKETLYEELLTVQQYNDQIRADEFDVQISAINDFLNLDQMEQIDSFMAQHEGYWAVKLLSLHTYMISFTSFYTPNFKLYKAAINDGTISLIDDKVFVADLEQIYVNGPSMIERLYSRESEINILLIDHVSRKYADLFTNSTALIDGNWTVETNREFLKRAIQDGEFRYKLRQKLSLIKSKSFILASQIDPVMERMVAGKNDMN